MNKKVLLPIADGVEEVEAIAVVDVLRRANAEVDIVGVTGLQVTTARGIKLIADKLLNECLNDTYDLIVLPGGMRSAESLRDCPELITMLRAQIQSGRLYAAICAAPVVILQHHGLLENKSATCHPSLYSQLKNKNTTRIVVDGNCITSQGPGTALEFAIKLVEMLFDVGTAQKIAQAMVV